jgi:hypothetical protein
MPERKGIFTVYSFFLHFGALMKLLRAHKACRFFFEIVYSIQAVLVQRDNP